MESNDPNHKSILRVLFNQAPFIADLGLEFKDAGPGWCETELPIQPKHLQQDGYVHAGVQAAMADHTAGAAAGTLVTESDMVLTIEFKINLLRPAKGERLRCRGQVIKSGKNITVVESKVHCLNEKEETFVSNTTVTLAIVPKTDRT